MAKKIIPLNKDIANDVLSGKIKGRVLLDGVAIERILCTDLKGSHDIVFTYMDGDREYVHRLCISDLQIELEVPDEPKKPKFKPFDRVLVRDHDKEEWRAEIFSNMYKEVYVCVGAAWSQCIPYEGNEHLVGTADKPKED